MAGVAQRVFLAARTRADRHHEPVRFHDAAAGNFDPGRPGNQHGAFGYDLYPGARHGLSARMTTSSSSRQPRRTRPVSSNHFARADSTGPNEIHWEAMTSASRPLARNAPNVCCTPANADWTNNRDPRSDNSFAADSHNGSSTDRPSGPAFHAHGGPASAEMTSAVVNRRRGHIGRIGYHDIERSTVESSCPRTLPDVHFHSRVEGVVAGALHGVGADVEGGDAGAAQFRSRDRDISAPGTQVKHPPARNDRGSFHRLHQQSRILLRLINPGHCRSANRGGNRGRQAQAFQSVRPFMLGRSLLRTD